MVLRELGGGYYSNFESLDGEYGIVGETERYRSLFSLPPEYMVLIEDGDVGMTLIHLPTGTTYWIGLYDYDALIGGRPLHNPYIYPRYGDLVVEQIKKYEQEKAGDNDA